jgi:mutator protein MutT
MMIAGRDYIGVGVGAMVFNAEGMVFLAKRGPQAKNERGCWEFPGGGVEFGETLVDAIRREFREEYQMDIDVVELLGVSDHILLSERQHWISPTFIARHVDGTPMIAELEKCTAIGWYSLSALPEPLSQITQDNLRQYRAKYPSPHLG